MARNSLKSVSTVGLVVLTIGFAPTNKTVFAQTDDYQCIWHTTGTDSGQQFGLKFTCIGDQNSDGCDDILVTSMYNDQVLLYYGGNPMDTIPNLVFEEPLVPYTPSAIGYLGRIEDANNKTLVISRNFYPSPNCVNIYYGGDQLDTIPEYVLMEEPESILFGRYVVSGDLNADGYDDVIVSDPNYTMGNYHGKIYVYFGSSSFDTISDLSWGNVNMSFGVGGFKIISVGDINADGFADILGRAGDDMVTIFLGGASMDTIPDWTYEHPQYMGILKAFIVPDVNDDEYDDIVVNLNTGFFDSETYIFYGGEEIGMEPDASFYSSDLTSDIDYAGDVNCDGYSDIIRTQYSTGDIEVYFGGPHSLWYPTIELYYWSHRVGYFGDVNGDGVDDFGFNANLNVPDFWGEVYIYSDPDLSVIKQFKIQNSKFKILSAYPNPFNYSTTILFSLPVGGEVTLMVYDLQGREAMEVFKGMKPAGVHNMHIDGSNLASGVYFVRLQAKGFSQARKMILIK